MASLKFLTPHGLHRRNLRGDLLGGVTAAVVALPLALAFGNAALGEGGAVYGLYGAVVVGFFAALFGGTPSQVSGPTGPMSVAVAGVVATLGELGINENLGAGELLPLVMAAVVLGGLFQILFGLLRLGRYVTLVPYSVVSGFMSGVGVIILLLQVGPFLGVSTRGGVVASLSQLHQHFIMGGGVNLAALSIGVMTVAVVFLTPKRITQILPSPLLALLIITPISLNWSEPVPRIGVIPEGGLHLALPAVGDHWGALIQAGLILAVLGSIDSLLTSLVADSLTHTQHKSDRELIGQGIGNSMAGLFSGLPGAGATMRTVINVKSGGKTPLSGVVHSITLLLVLVGAGPLAAQIPNALLAGILMKVGIDIIDWNFLFRGAPHLHQDGRGHVWGDADDCVLGSDLGCAGGNICGQPHDRREHHGVPVGRDGDARQQDGQPRPASRREGRCWMPATVMPWCSVSRVPSALGPPKGSATAWLWCAITRS